MEPGRTRPQRRIRAAVFAVAAGAGLILAGSAAAEEPSLTPPAGPAGLTEPTGAAPADSSPDQPGPAASQGARDNTARSLPGPRSDGGMSGGLVAACLLAVVAGVAAAASGVQRRRAAL